MKMKKRSLIARIATFAVVLGGTGFGAYLLIPSKKIAVVQKTSEDVPSFVIDDSTYLGRFIQKVQKVTTGELEEETVGLSATLEDFEVTWPSKSGLSMNDIKAEGLINLSMKSLQDFNLTLDLDADYNSNKLDVGIGLVDQTLYLAVKDLKLKSSYSSSKQFISTIEDLFFNPENPNGLGIDFDISGTLNGLIGNIDLDSLNLSGLSVTETETETDVDIKVGIMAGIELGVQLDKETLALKCLDLGTLVVGDVVIKGKIKCNVIPGLKVYGLDSPDYPGKQRTDFVEIINYVGWADRILNLLNTKKIGLNLSASLLKNNDNNIVTKITSIDASLNIDAENLFDVKDINLNNLSLLDASEVEENPEIEEASFLDKLLDELKFDAYFSVEGQEDYEYANLGLTYFDRAGYLSLNETEDDAVMRAKIELNDVIELINKVPEMISTFSNGDKEAEKDAQNLFEFVTSSELVTAIKDGMYDGIVKMIKSIKNTNNTIELEVSLSSLGFGEQSIIKLILNADEDAINNGNKVISIEAKNVEIGSLVLDLSLATMGYSDTHLKKVENNKTKYDDLGFINGIFDQISTILDKKSAYFDLDGSVLDNQGLGFTFTGWGQFDYGQKFGYGSATFSEYKTSATSICATHTLDIDVDNRDENNDNKNMLFEYRETLKGKFTVKTLNDVVDLVKELLSTDDVRFTKFIEPILDMILAGIIKEVIDSGDYVALAKSSVIKKIAQNATGTCLDVVIAKEILDLDNDLQLRINFDTTKNKAVKSIQIMNLKLGAKTINLTISIGEFKANLTSPVDKTATFYDFSDIAVLLRFGINSTMLNVYHLTAPIKIVIADIIPLSISLDFYIQVDGVSVKVYGKIPNVPWLSDFASADLGSVKVSSEFVFEPDHSASDNDVGGYFHIVRTENHWINKDDASYYYRCASSNFIGNIVDYLLRDMLNFKDSVINKIGEISTDSVEDSDYENLFNENGFKYTHSDQKDVWNIDLNLKALTGVSALGSLKLDLTGVYVDGVGYFNTAVIKLVVASVVTITGTITLENPNPDTLNWPDSIENRYQKIIGVYNKLSDSDKSNFDLNYLNKPRSDYRINVL